MTVSVIVPILNEPGIARFLDRLHKVMTDIQDNYEILVVMGDRETLHPTIPSRPNQRILKSYGDSLERAILLGLSCARGERVLVCDADGSHPLESIPTMIRGLDKCEMVVGSRYLSGSEFEYSSFRKLVAWCFRSFAKLMGSSLSDPMSGFFAINTKILEKLKFTPYKWKTALEIEMKVKPEILEIPISFSDRKEGVSKATFRTGINLIMDLALS